MTEWSRIPNKSHWAILSPVTITIPGDERSQTNPGHGYPQHSETFYDYTAFVTEDSWKQAISQLVHSKYIHRTFKAFKVEVAEVEIQVNVK